MNTVTLENIVPDFFPVKREDGRASEVWNVPALHISRGERILLRGGSGSGKTSLLNFICGFRSDFSGRISYDGIDINSLTEKQKDDVLQRHVAVLFQDMRLFPKLTSMENVMIKAGITSEVSAGELEAMLCEVGLKDKMNVPVSFLSIGQQQRVAFVRMMAQKADFWIMDEPVSHIDDHNAGIMAEILKREIEKSGAAVIASSVGRDFPIEYSRTIQL